MVELVASDYRVVAQVIVAWALCSAALIWGGGPERAIAITWLIVFEIGLRLAPHWLGLRFQYVDIELWLFTGELIACAMFIAIALVANRNYALGVAAMQVLAVTAHLARGIAETVAPIAYLVMIAVPGWAQLFLLAIGLVRHILRKRKYGDYRDWRISNPLSAIAKGAAQLSADSAWQRFKQPSWRDDLK